MLESNEVIAFAAAADLTRARAFYEGKLGLPLVEQNDFACVFDANGTMLRLAIVGELSPAPWTVLGWQVSDIDAAVENLSARGVHFERFPQMGQDEQGIWNSPGGARVAWFKDPDGNVLSISQ